MGASQERSGPSLNCLIRLGILAAVIIGSVLGIGNLGGGDDECNSTAAKQWVEVWSQRMEAASADWESFLQAPNGIQWSSYLSRAKVRLDSQQQESAPSCLADLQEKTVTLFRYQWLMCQSVVDGNLDEAESDAVKASDAYNEVLQEAREVAHLPPPTSGPAPTHTAKPIETPTPMGGGCISWQQASDYIGKQVCVCGTVHHIQSSRSPFFIHFATGDDSFYGYSYKWYWTEGQLEGKCVVVCGTVETNYGRPRMLIDDAGTQVFWCQ